MVSVIGREAATEANASAFSLEPWGRASVSNPESGSSIVLPERSISSFGGLGTRILR